VAITNPFYKWVGIIMAVAWGFLKEDVKICGLGKSVKPILATRNMGYRSDITFTLDVPYPQDQHVA
jgi:hypothetical protein